MFKPVPVRTGFSYKSFPSFGLEKYRRQVFVVKQTARMLAVETSFLLVVLFVCV